MRAAPITGLTLLLLNDHVLKGSGVLPSWVTGKLSDAAGLFVFPLFVAAILYTLRRVRGSATPLRRSDLGAICLITALGFSALQLLGAVAQIYTAMVASVADLLPGLVASVTMDPSDLLALPFVWLAFSYGTRHLPDARGRTSTVSAAHLSS